MLYSITSQQAELHFIRANMTKSAFSPCRNWENGYFIFNNAFQICILILKPEKLLVAIILFKCRQVQTMCYFFSVYVEEIKVHMVVVKNHYHHFSL